MTEYMLPAMHMLVEMTPMRNRTDKQQQKASSQYSSNRIERDKRKLNGQGGFLMVGSQYTNLIRNKSNKVRTKLTAHTAHNHRVVTV